jgi:DNA primase
MITLDGIVILADVHTILKDLKFDLTVQESPLLKDLKFRDSSKDVMVTCPVHGGGSEKNPSCGISRTEVKRNGKLYPAGTVHCFTCGYQADLFEFVSYCFGTTQRDFGKRYVIRKYNTMQLSERPTITLNTSRIAPGVKPYKYIDESILDNYRYTSDYLIARQFELNTILFYEYGVNLQNNTITMPIRDHLGGLVFIKQRFINPAPGQDKYLNATGVPKQHILYGFNHVLNLIKAINNGTCTNKKLEENYKKYGVILTEGEFNASYLMQNGFVAVSLLGRILFSGKSSGTIQQRELLLRNGVRRITPWMDWDEHGQTSQAKIIMELYKDFIIHQPNYLQFPDKNDANDFEPWQLDELEFIPFNGKFAV